MCNNFRVLSEVLYKCILEFPLIFPLVLRAKPQDEIEKIRREIEGFDYGCDTEPLSIRFDSRPAIRPVGIRLEDIINWLKEPRIYDTSDKELKRLEDVYKAYYRELLRYSILCRVFIDRDQFKANPHIVEKIKRLAKERLEELDREWSEMFSP